MATHQSGNSSKAATHQSRTFDELSPLMAQFIEGQLIKLPWVRKNLLMSFTLASKFDELPPKEDFDEFLI